MILQTALFTIPPWSHPRGLTVLSTSMVGVCTRIVLAGPKLCRLQQQMDACAYSSTCTTGIEHACIWLNQRAAHLSTAQNIRTAALAAHICRASILLGVVGVGSVSSTRSTISQQALLLLRGSPAARGTATGGDLAQKIFHALL